MRFALVTRAYPTHKAGGLPHVVQDRAHELTRRGHDVHVVTTTGAGTSDGDVVIHCGGPAKRYSRAFATHCREKVDELTPDVVHLDSFDRAHRWWEGLDVTVTMHGFGFGAALTHWTRYRLGSTKEPPVFGAALRDESRMLAQFSRVLAISDHERWMLGDCYGLGNVTLIHNPIAPYFFDETREQRGSYFLCVGNPGTSQLRNFGEVARHTRVPVKVCRDVPRPGLPAVYDSARATVIPTFWAQGYDLTVAESLARCRPVIASYTGSYARGESPHIHTFPPGDWTALRSLLSTALPPVAPGAADRHKPRAHVDAWLEAVL